MTEYIQIEWMAANGEEARKIVEKLLEDKLIACANFIQEVESYYTWKGAIETSIEVKVLLKSHKECFDRIEALITKQSSYEVPAILAFSIVEGNQKYLQWLADSINIHALEE